MPPLRPRPAPPDRGRAATALGAALVPPAAPPPATIGQLIAASGGTRAAAALVGRSARTVRRWAAGQVQHVPDEAQHALLRAGIAARNRQLIDEMGGVRQVSQITGRSVRTVQRWARGDITRPRLDAQQILGRADAAVRMRDLGLQIDPATGLPQGKIYLQLSGSIRVNASRTAGYSYPSRSIGGREHPLGLAIDDPQVIADMVQALGQNDPEAAQAILEAHLSNDYAAVGSYDQRQQIGLFIDSITSIEFNQVASPGPPPTTPTPGSSTPAPTRQQSRRAPRNPSSPHSPGPSASR